MSNPVVANISCVWPAGRLLGEGPWWSERDASLYWVDIKRPAILRYSPATGAMVEWPCPEPIGCCAPRRGTGMVVALESGFYTAELGPPGSPIAPEYLCTPPGLIAGDRFNDGKCHPDGSFWAGTMDDAERSARGWFYRLLPDRQIERIAGPYAVCNGPAFSPDGRVAYLTDSASRRVFRCELGRARLSPESFLLFGSADGYPDGMTVDTEGRLWIALWDGAKVVCVGPDGKRLLEITLPVSRPTSCAFGGPSLRTLYVSSASIGLSEEQKLRESLAGGLFAIDLESVEGCPTSFFEG
ncbi:MAG: SMP-30/gluconolactonase/LRE family protein [Deltaproteobacteria bacterium]|nr:SMP-30/gluconolactonase/LRE family protein [Deltaproteobacteria bacterium]